jgi:hypothetical protein
MSIKQYAETRFASQKVVLNMANRFLRQCRKT